MSLFIVTGALARDAELKSAGQKTVLKFSIPDVVGFGQNKVKQWINCSFWRGDNIAQFMTKGKTVECWGELTTRIYEKDGKPTVSLDLNCQGVKLHGGGERDDGPVADRGRATRGAATPDRFPNDSGGEIPF